MATAAREPLLLHQFLSGIPEPISRQLVASGEIKTLDKAIERARLLMTIEPEPVAALQENPSVTVGKPNEIQMLREQMAALTEQVAELTIRQSRTRQQARRPPCFFRIFASNRCECNWARSCFGAGRTPYCLCQSVPN